MSTASNPSLGRRNANPRGLTLLELLREDLATHDDHPLEAGFLALAVHRFGNWRMDLRRRWLRAPCTVAYQVARHAVLYGLGIKLDYTVEVGRRVRIWHHGGMVLGARKIGDDVHIRQNTTFGVRRRDRPFEKPTIGDRVDIGCGAVIIGGVTIGSDTVIGANAVVTRDVPPGSVVVGASARIIDGREDDSSRAQSCDRSRVPSLDARRRASTRPSTRASASTTVRSPGRSDSDAR